MAHPRQAYVYISNTIFLNLADQIPSDRHSMLSDHVTMSERSFVGTLRSKATISKSDGKLKSIADNRSDSQANLQQGEDHRCPRSNAARARGHQQPEQDRCNENRSAMTATR